jgi:hypothetical protein
MRIPSRRRRMRQSAIGRVYLLNSHGSIVYLNRQEQSLLYGLQVFAGLSFGSAVIIDVIRRGNAR